MRPFVSLNWHNDFHIEVCNALQRSQDTSGNVVVDSWKQDYK